MSSGAAPEADGAAGGRTRPKKIVQKKDNLLTEWLDLTTILFVYKSDQA